MAGTSKRHVEMGRWPAPLAAILSQRDVRDKVSVSSRLRREAGRQRRGAQPLLWQDQVDHIGPKSDQKRTLIALS
jgi:hypothetical protein